MLHEAEMKGDLIVHVIHVTGTRMKELGIGGLSRGDLLEDVVDGKYPFSMLPLYFEALERLVGLEQWIRYWWVCHPLINGITWVG